MSGTIEIIVVMRHGCRADKAGEEWSESETRPWDSPLSKKGWKETVRSGKELNKLLKRKPDLIFTSPYTRCLQTASALAKTCGVPFKDMIVERGLSETYDYLHTVRTVSSNDMVVGEEYVNMKEWFFSDRRQTKDSSAEWKLKPGLTLDQRVDRFVYDIWKPPKKDRTNLRICGKFPNFEMYVNMGFNRGEQVKRYVRALKRCLKELRGKNRGLKKLVVIVTHGAGVKALHEHFLQTSLTDVDTAGYFVVCRKGKERFRLLSDRLVKSS